MTRSNLVLVVDDEPGLASLYGVWLQDQYEVRCETGGESALSAIEDGVDAIMLDRQMPDCSGDEVLQRLRTAGNTCPVALVTAAKPDDAAFALPFDDYLIKPVERDELVSSAERLLALSRYDAASRRCLRLSVKLALVDSVAPALEETRDELYATLRAEFADALSEAEVPVTELPLHWTLSDALDSTVAPPESERER